MARELRRSSSNKKILGVCGGIAEYFEIDATVVRMVVAIITVLTTQIVLGFILYLLCGFILPSTKDDNKINE